MLHNVKSWKAWLAALGFAILPTFYAVIWVFGAWQELQEPLLQIPQMGVHSLPLSTEIFDRRGAKIGEFAEERRYFVRLSTLPRHVIQAFLSAEDKNFYDHHGVSPSSIVRAILANLRGGGFRQGASTITQQLARMRFLSQEKSLARKVKEAVLAIAIEQRFHKDQILELYLNTIYLGSRSHGVEASARNFFRKSAEHLTVEEAAMLAALPKSPAHYSPHRHPMRALERRAWVLSRMEEDGYLPPGKGRELSKSQLKVAEGPEDHWSKAPYFVSAVLQDLFRKFEMIGLPRHGLRIYTTLDSSLQTAGESILKEQLAAIEKGVPSRSMHKDRLEGALVIVDPETGGILAMQGGRRFTESQFNRTASALRPIGSLMNPFLLALALERGLSPLSPISPEFTGRMSPKTSNAVRAISLADLIFDPDLKEWSALAPLLGFGSVADMLKRVRLVGDSEGSLDPSRDVRSTPLRVGLSYASLVNGGYPVSPRLVTRVEDRDGHILFESERSNGREKQALDGKVAFVTRELLAVGPYSQLPTALQKTLPQTTSTLGRSIDGGDVWFVGLVPSAVSVLWVGSEHGRISIEMPAEKAKNLSRSFWQLASTAMQRPEDSSNQRFSPPLGVSYLRMSGVDGLGVNVPVMAGTIGSQWR